MRNIHLLTGLLLTIACSTSGQTVKLPFAGPDNPWDMTTYNFTTGKWEAMGKAKLTLETYLGKESVHLKAGTVLHTKNIDFKDGTIEVDINFPDQRNFPGLAFRMQDFNNFENFYIGAQKGGKADATRYTPVFNGQQAWQLYYGEGYSKAFPFTFNTWHHLKLDIHGFKAEVYIDDMQTPLYKITELKREWKGGDIALISDEAAVHFANAQYTPRTLNVPTPIAIPATGTNGLITQWQVSNVVNRSSFDKKYQLTPDLKQQLTWTTHRTDSSGVLNLYRFVTINPTANTMVAKVVIESATEQVKALSFGFSDAVAIYLNDKILYQGNDTYGTRDYQFIGTIGLFDRLFLPLKKGTNELWFVVSEDFGGWGVQATFDDMGQLVLK